MEEIEIIAIDLKLGHIRKKLMSFDSWIHFHKNKRKQGFKYIAYQKGFSQFNLTK